MPLSGVVPLCDGVVARLDGGHLARMVLELLGHKRGLLSLVRIERQLVRWMEGLLGWVGRVLGPNLITSLSCLHREVLMSMLRFQPVAVSRLCLVRTLW